MPPLAESEQYGYVDLMAGSDDPTTQALSAYLDAKSNGYPSKEKIKPTDELSTHPESESGEGVWENDHNPYEEVERLKKAMKVALVILANTSNDLVIKSASDAAIRNVAKKLGLNAPSQRTIELVNELILANAKYSTKFAAGKA